MKTRLQPIYLALGAAFLTSGCVRDSSGQTGGATATVASARSECTTFLTVNESNDLHLQEQHKLRVNGPDGVGDYGLHPIPGGMGPPHQLLIKSHPLLKSDLSDEKFVGVLEIKGTGHAQVSQHAYDVMMEFDADGCPSRLTFDAQQPQEHMTTNDGDTDHHGGHAVAD
jgi:hypothetical protein